jgi:hypothetical protein
METHKYPKFQDWEAFVENENCVNVKIDESLEIEGAKIKFLGKNREPLIEMGISSRNIRICLAIGNPIFVELHTSAGVSVQYVKGSGKELYKSYKDESNEN